MQKNEFNLFIKAINHHSDKGNIKLAFGFYKLMLIRIGQSELARLHQKLDNKKVIAMFKIELAELELREKNQTSN